MAKFPDLNKDGKVTQKDILMGRGVNLANGGRIVYKEDGDQIGGNPTKGTKSQGQRAYEEQIKNKNKFLKELEKEMNRDKDGN
jgi:hypothetical protein